MGTTQISSAVVRAARTLARNADTLQFTPPVTHVYNPLVYARAGHEAYLRRFCNSSKRILFLGMNPGPWGMTQTGVPFGEVHAVTGWMGLREPVAAPSTPHPKRPIEGFDCPRSEVSGRRLWGLFAERFGEPEAFFADHFVVNYCPLVFMGETGRNITPNKIPAAEITPLSNLCDTHLRAVVGTLQPEWLVAIGGFAEKRIHSVFGDEAQVARILHPSPASPAANRDWAGTATRQLEEQGVW
jgi:single-strand selective monofunctional uracil DNA glycosylase